MATRQSRRRAVAAAGLAAAAVGSLIQPSPAVAQAAGDPRIGKMVYEGKCGGCHSVDMNRIGPLHRGVVGRAPGSVAGFAYSPALKRLGGVWNAARLNIWLLNPQKMAPGTRMYLSVPDAGQRANIIAYLQSVSAKPR